MKRELLMKIMHFIHGLNTGGAETLVKNYMLNFDKKNDLVLLCIEHHRESPYEKTLEESGIKVIYVEDELFLKKNGGFSRFVNHFYRYFIVKKNIRREKPDILHTHLTLNRFVKFARPSGKVVIFHTVHSEPKKIWLNGNKKRKKDFEAAKWLVKNRNMHLIVLHREMQEEIKKVFGTNPTIINNGINISEYEKPRDKSLLRHKFNIPRDAFVIGHVGRFAAVKNHDFLVDVFEKIKNPNKFLLMVGDGDGKIKIIEKLQDCDLDRKYLILSNRDDISDILHTMDVFVFPSFHEGMPTSLIESQVSGLPCFVSDTVNEDVAISNLIVRLPLADGPEAWVKAIKNYKKPDRIMINDRNWDIKDVVMQLEKLYRKKIKERSYK